MLIALDFDGTYTEDPILWDGFIKAASSRGHEVIVVTMRYEREGDDIIAALPGCRVIYTNRMAKVKYVNSIGFAPDIWIDDSPHWLLNNAA